MLARIRCVHRVQEGALVSLRRVLPLRIRRLGTVARTRSIQERAMFGPRRVLPLRVLRLGAITRTRLHGHRRCGLSPIIDSSGGVALAWGNVDRPVCLWVTYHTSPSISTTFVEIAVAGGGAAAPSGRRCSRTCTVVRTVKIKLG
jgi:hypothetical protein